MRPKPLAEDDRASLARVMRASIAHGFEAPSPLLPEPSQHSAALQRTRGVFVTLTLDERLRGCIGSLIAQDPLIVAAARMAFAAANRDPRFTPLTEHEADRVAMSISILSPLEPLAFKDEDDLLSKLRVGVDGLVLRDGPHTGTFLPALWDRLPTPRAFLTRLRLKAGLSPSHWSQTLRVDRYTTRSYAWSAPAQSAAGDGA